MLKNKIESLINLIKNTEIEEIEVTSFWGAQKIRLSTGIKKDKQKHSKKEQTNEVFISDVVQEEKETVPKNMEQKEKDTISTDTENIISDNSINLKAPLVGTYYSSPKPSDPPFINIGDKVTKGQIVCIIEAMKIFNEIESEHSGIVTDILVKDSDPVEFDQVIIKISSD